MSAAEIAAVVLEVPGNAREVRLAETASEVAIVRQGFGRPGADLEVFPLGTCYARNRGASTTSARVLVFADSDGSFELAVSRERFLAVGGFDHALGLGTFRGGAHDWELGARLGLTTARPPVGAEPIAAGRVARRRRDLRLAAAAALRGGARGVLGRSGWAPPQTAFEYIPQELRAAGPFRPLAAANPAKTHFIYAAGDDAVLHLHVNPSARLRRSLAERESIRADAPPGAVPRLKASASSLDSLWVLEERIDGERLDRVSAQAGVLDWTLALAGPPGRPLQESPYWDGYRDRVVAAAPPGLQIRMADAFETIGKLPSRHMHGDLQPKNILAHQGRLTAIDWEGAWREGIPGLDLVYLGAFVRALELNALPQLPPQPRAALASLGLDDRLLPPALLVMLGTWAVAEADRRRRLGSTPPPPEYGPLLAARGPAVASVIA